MDLFLFQVATAMGLFLFVNWLGRQTEGWGYETITMLSAPDESAAFNFFFRVISPLVFLILVAAGCQAIHQGRLTSNLHHSLLYYFGFRVAYNLAMGRGRLLPWSRLVVQWLVTFGAGWLVYVNLISRPEYLLPDLDTIGNELWLAIGAYGYLVANRMIRPDASRALRTLRYVRLRFYQYSSRYGGIIGSATGNCKLQSILYAVLLLEDFNRPRVYRGFERLLFRFGLAKSIGIMQVKTDMLLSDEDSVRLGVTRILSDYEYVVSAKEWSVRQYLGDLDLPRAREMEERSIIHGLLVRYNPSGDYAREVVELSDLLQREFFAACADSLHPDINPNSPTS